MELSTRMNDRPPPSGAELNIRSRAGQIRFQHEEEPDLETWKNRVGAVWDKPAPHSHTATALHVVRHCNNVTFCKVFILIAIKIPGLASLFFLIFFCEMICINKHFFVYKSFLFMTLINLTHFKNKSMRC